MAISTYSDLFNPFNHYINFKQFNHFLVWGNMCVATFVAKCVVFSNISGRISTAGIASFVDQNGNIALGEEGNNMVPQ